MSTLPPTRAAGLARLSDFVPRAGQAYAAGRNTDPGPGQPSAVSGLSPYIRHRLVTEAEVVRAVLDRHAWPDAEKFIQEVFWRSYWKCWLEQRPHIWDAYTRKRDTALDMLATDAALRTAYARAVTGATGIACFDAWARELTDTNTLHNHARMWFASIWVFTLRLPWALGADFFLQHLLDGDAASNTLSWRWVMGSQTRGKHYVATAANIARYTQGRFDPSGQLDENPLPLTGDAPPPPRPMPAADALPRGKLGLLLHDDDFGVETLALAGADIGSVAAFAAPSARSPSGCGDAVAAFAAGARDDTLARAGALFGVPAHALHDYPQSVLDWIKASGLATIVTPALCVGWTATRMAAIRQAMAAHGASLHTLRRTWDAACWPHATRGFFAFRARIPDILRDSGG